MKTHLKTILFYVLLIGVIVAVVATIFQGTEEEKLVLADVVGFTSIDEIVSYGEQGKFVDVMAPENLAKMPNFAKLFVEDAEVNRDYMLSAAEDGSHYILPAYGLERSVNHYWIYNETAFEEAGAKVTIK